MAIVTDQDNNSTLGRVVVNRGNSGNNSAGILGLNINTFKKAHTDTNVASGNPFSNTAASNANNLRIDTTASKVLYSLHQPAADANNCRSPGSGGGSVGAGDIGGHSEQPEQPQNAMEYAWLEPRHDPIATDTNLAEIDFENFKNEDLAYAFSCGVRHEFFFSIAKIYPH